ncbi:hypothetical protein RHMOL_Rhmol09G0010300 [Rhododendron molle]|uniref:Uncharacterized protein n=1 Tax=Rhododendron molle TaxID=49168 RepID=A0ACC0M8E0_RHOML|nr:hypothetical protein RHMOL_Rhmol09G0010300 [Rhododendron molle]
MFGSLPHLKDGNGFKIGYPCFSYVNQRKYSSQKFSEPISKTVTANGQVCNIADPIPKIWHPETHSILQSSGLQHWFKNWQELRKHKLTASTFSGAVGFWPRRRVQLWLEKLGAIEPFTGNLATCWSNIKEEEALERYKLITGNDVLFPEFQVYKKNPDDDWLAASPDGVVDTLVYGLPSRGILEIKCPFFGGDMKKASPWSRIPLYCIPQTQGLMEIMDRDWMDFYVWTPNGSSLFRLYRDVEYWDALRIALSDFWWKHVQPAREVCSKSVITNPLTQPVGNTTIVLLFELKKCLITWNSILAGCPKYWRRFAREAELMMVTKVVRPVGTALQQDLRERDGIPDLRQSARFRYGNVTLPEVDGSVRKLLKSGKDLDDTLTAAVIRNLKIIQDRSKVVILDADGTRSKSIARSLKKLGVKASII